MPSEAARDEASAFLLELAQALHVVALPADVVGALLGRAASGLGLHTEVVALQSFVAIGVSDLGPDVGRPRVTLRRISFDPHWNLRRTGALIALVDGVAAARVGVIEGRLLLREITGRPGRYAKPLVMAAYGVYGAAVAARIGGAWLEMLAAALVGLAAGMIHFGSLSSSNVNLLKSLLGSVTGALVGFALAFVLPPLDLGRAVFGGITLLVPAMVITIGVHELAHEELESGAVRLAYGLLRFLMLAYGLGIALAVTRLLGWSPAHRAAVPLPTVFALAAVGVGGAALVVCLQARPRDIPWIIGAAALAYGTQQLTKVVLGGSGSPFISALVLGVAAHLYSRMPGHVGATVVVPGLLQLAPGFAGTQAAFAIVHGAGPDQGAGFAGVLLDAFQLATGLFVAGLIVRQKAPRRLPSAGQPLPESSARHLDHPQ